MIPKCKCPATVCGVLCPMHKAAPLVWQLLAQTLGFDAPREFKKEVRDLLLTVKEQKHLIGR